MYPYYWPEPNGRSPYTCNLQSRGKSSILALIDVRVLKKCYGDSVSVMIDVYIINVSKFTSSRLIASPC